jgi:murein DD-endopeptidase MepM/ murein hydrolase activator NlpD
MRTKSKGISIVFIPARGNTITLLVSPLYLYLLFITVFALVFFSTQFFTKLRQVKLNYIAVSSFSEDEKQQLLSEELSVVQDELTAINTIHLANKAMTGTIATLDKENRKKLSLREYNFEYAVNTKNQHLTSINVSLNPSSVLTFKEKVTLQNTELRNRTRTQEIAALAGNDYVAEKNKLPIGYPYGNASMISPGFGYRIHPIWRTPDYHTGVDISAPYGYGLKATGDGRVVEAGWSGGYGLMVKIYHRNGIESLYAHCSELLVDVGDYVKREQVIAKAGATGTASETHVHYEIIRDNKRIDPEEFNQEIEKANRR